MCQTNIPTRCSLLDQRWASVHKERGDDAAAGDDDYDRDGNDDDNDDDNDDGDDDDDDDDNDDACFAFVILLSISFVYDNFMSLS